MKGPLGTDRGAGAEGAVQLGRGPQIRTFLHLRLQEFAVTCGVVFTQLVQHRPKLPDLPQQAAAGWRGGHRQLRGNVPFPSRWIK